MAQFEYTFPQDWGTGSHPQYEGDPNDAANFGSLIGATSPVSALIRGINFTVDYANNTVDTTEGKVYLVGDNITAGTSQTERDEVGFVNGLKAKTGLTLTDAAVNHVYVATDPTTNNEPRVEINDTGTPPTGPSVKVGEIDTSAGTKSEQWNLVAGNGMLTYPDNSALTASASLFENGVPLFDRATEEISVVDSSGVSLVITGGVGADDLTVDSFKYDPGMVEWEDGLADEEVARIQLQAGEELVIERIEFQQKGGGSSTSADLDVRDVTAATTVGTQDLGGVTKDAGTSGSGNTVIIRLTNSTGGVLNANPRITGYITGA